MQKNLLFVREAGRRIAAAGLLTGLIASMALPASAAPTMTSGVIDYSQTGSITLTKIIENDGQNLMADGANPINSADAEAGTSVGGLSSGQSNDAHTDLSGIPVDNIEFSYLKIADIVNVSGTVSQPADRMIESSTVSYQGVGAYFRLNEAGEALKNAVAGFGIEPSGFTINRATFYRTSDLENWLAAINNIPGPIEGTGWEEGLNGYLKANGSAFDVTNSAGVTSADELPLGLYIVCETDISAHDGKADIASAAALMEDGANVSLQGKVDITDVDETGRTITVRDNVNNRTYTYNDGDFYSTNVNPEAIGSTGTVIESLATPFLVAIPSTNIAAVTDADGTVHQAGTVWVYDQSVFPKDQTASIHKKTVDPDENGTRYLRDYEDYQIGDTLEQVIWADAPALQNAFSNAGDDSVNTTETVQHKKRHEKYVISDTMAAGLSLSKITKVLVINKYDSPTKVSDFTSRATTMDGGYVIENGEYVMDEDGDAVVNDVNANVLKPNEHYEVYKTTSGDISFTDGLYKSADGSVQSFSVELTEDGLAKLDTITQDSQVVVLFDVVLNKDAAIGEESDESDDANPANEDHPTLTWKNTSSSERTIEGNHVYAYTYELDLIKDGLSRLPDAAFVMTRKNDTAEHYNEDQQDSSGNVTAKAGTIKKGTDDDRTDKAVKEADNAKNSSTAAASGTNAYDSTLGRELMKFVPEVGSGGSVIAGEYHLYDNSKDSGITTIGEDLTDSGVTGVTTGSTFTTVLHPASDGRLIIRGLDSDSVYTLKEVKTQEGGLIQNGRVNTNHNLLATTIDIKLTAVKADGETAVTKAGILEGGHQLTGKVTGTAATKNGTDEDAASYSVALAYPDITNEGIVGFEIDNYKSVTLRTGGSGRYMIYFCGAAGFAALIAAYAVKKRRKDTNDTNA